MRPIRLELNNIGPYGHQEMDLSGVTAAAIVGPNGAGKSTICKAVLRGLFSGGRSILPESFLRVGSETGSIELEYEAGGNRYRIVRTAGKRTELQYMIANGEGWSPLTAATAAETQAKINHDLAMDEALFLASSCVMQGESAGICEATAAERKAVLYRVLEDRLARFAPLHEAAKQAVKELDSATAAIRAKRSDLEAKIATKTDEIASRTSLRSRLDEYQAMLTQREEALRTAQAAAAGVIETRRRWEDKSAEIERTIGERNSLSSRAEDQLRIAEGQRKLLRDADEIRTRVAEADKIELEIQGFESARERRREAQAGYDQKKLALEREGEALGAQENRLEMQIEAKRRDVQHRREQAAVIDPVPCADTPMVDVCPVLDNARRGRDGIKDLQADLDALNAEAQETSDRIAGHTRRHKAELDPLAEAVSSIVYSAELHEAAEVRLGQLRQARSMLPEIAAAQSRLEAAEQARAGFLSDVAEKEAQADALRAELATMSVPDADAEADVHVKEAAVRHARAETDCVNRELAVSEERLRVIEQAEADLILLADKLAGEEERRVVMATLQSAFSRDGIAALIIDAAIPQIEAHANEILARLSDGRMRLKFVTQEATKTAGIKETLDIIVSDLAGERVYEDWSGGERVRIDLAVRIALGRVLAHRSGCAMRTLLLDEVCAPLDEAGKGALVDCVNRLSGEFDCILLITHHEALKDMLAQQIIVARNGGESEVRMVV